LAPKGDPHQPRQYRYQTQDYSARRTDVTGVRLPPHQCHIGSVRPDRATAAISPTGRT